MIKKSAHFGTDLIWRSWVILGPVFLSLTIIISILSVSSALFVVPLIALAGLVLTHLWGWRGVFITSLLLLCASTYMFATYPQSVWIWNIVLAAACMCSLIATRLGFDEYEAQVASRFRETERDSHVILEMKNALQKSEETHKEELETLQATIASLKAENLRSAEALAVKEHLLGLTRDEVSVVDVERQRLMRTIVLLQRDNSDVQQIADDLKAQLEGTVQQQAEVQELTEYVKVLEREKQLATEKYAQDLKSFENRMAEQQQQSAEAATKHQEHVQELNAAMEALKNENHKLAEELQKLSEDVATGRETRRLQGFYNQLRAQFEEKSKVLDETRRELFTAQEKIAASERALELNDLAVNKAHDEHCKRLLAEAAEEIERLEKEHQEEIAQLQDLVDTLMDSATLASAG